MRLDNDYGYGSVISYSDGSGYGSGFGYGDGWGESESDGWDDDVNYRGT